MSLPVRPIAGIAALLLFVWMIVLVAAGPSITFKALLDDDPGEFTAHCSPVFAPFGDRHYTSDVTDAGSYRTTFRLSSSDLPGGTAADPFAPERQIDMACDQARTARAGLVGLLAGPAALLAVVSVFYRRRDPLLDPAPQVAVPTGA